MLFNFEGLFLKTFKRWHLYPVYGGVAQLGEHLPCTQGVRSSILLISTRGYEEEGRTKTAANDYGLIAQVVRAHA